MKSVPFFDLKRQYAALKPQIEAAVSQVLESQHFIGGPHVMALEEELSDFVGSAGAVGVSSGTDALLASLMALEIGPGDEVITTPFTFFAPVESILRVGATPVFVDIDPMSFNIDAAQIEAAITERTKAIMPVHLFGQCADMTAIMELAHQYELLVIEDNAQALGATHRGRQAGSFGELGCVSFFPTKNLGGAGDGGMVFCADKALAEQVRLIGRHGARPKYHHLLVGGNFRLDAIQAAILRVKLRSLRDWARARQEHAAFYDEALQGVEGLRTPVVSAGNESVYNQYTIRVDNRDEVARRMQARGVGTNIYYPEALHVQPALEGLGYHAGDFPEAERACREVLSLPIFPELTEPERQYVVEALTDVLAGQ